MKDKIIKNLYIILIVIIGLVLTILPIIFSIKILLYKEEINSDLMQAEVLSSCISIIGFAVTVWAGLNIYNYLEKKDFEKYVEEYDDTWNNVKKLYEHIKSLSVDDYLKIYHMISEDVSGNRNYISTITLNR